MTKAEQNVLCFFSAVFQSFADMLSAGCRLRFLQGKELFFQGVSPQFRFFLYGRVGGLMERNVFL